MKLVKGIQEKIVEVANSFVGQKEIPGNQGWNDKLFQRLMERVGWQTGHAWCSYFGELVLKLAYDGNKEHTKVLDKLCSPSAVKTLDNFRKAGYTVSNEATPGALAIWQTKQRGMRHWTGHVGVVVEAHQDYFVTIEGNTNDAGGRAGEVVARRKRRYSFNIYAGLELQGFIHPIGAELEIDPLLPFKNKTEGNKFRSWVNNNHEEYAREIDLDRKGSHKNSYITKAYEKLGKLYEAKQ